MKATLNRLDARDPAFDASLTKLLAFDAAQDEAIEAATARILHEVRTEGDACLLYTSPSPRDRTRSRMPSSA